MFRATALENVRRLLSHKDQTRLTVEDAYMVFFTDYRLEMDKKAASTSVHAITEEQEAATQDQKVTAFRLQQKQQTLAQQ
jgi:hypothetical protein